jgi:hypothetical protein
MLVNSIFSLYFHDLFFESIFRLQNITFTGYINPKIIEKQLNYF